MKPPQAGQNRGDPRDPVQGSGDDQSVLRDGLTMLLRKGLPIRSAQVPEQLLRHPGVRQQAFRADDPASLADGLTASIRHALAAFEPLSLRLAAQQLFGATPDSSGQTLTARRVLAAASSNYDPTHFRKHIEANLVRDLAESLHVAILLPPPVQQQPDKLSNMMDQFDPHASLACDILVVVPKFDELRAAEVVFDADFSTPAGVLEYDEAPVYLVPVEDDAGNLLKVGFVEMGGQGNVASALTTTEAVARLEPKVAIMIGTALGNAERCRLFDVVFAEEVTDLTEYKARVDGSIGWRPDQHQPWSRMRREVGRFRERLDLAPFHETLVELARQRVPDHLSGVTRTPPSVHFEAMASGASMVVDPELQAEIWRHDDRFACYDMDSAGFARVAKAQSGIQWMVIRGISDYGDAATKSDPAARQLATMSAALLLRTLIVSGLKQCHPFQVRVPTATQDELPDSHFYVQRSGLEYFQKRIAEDLQIRLPPEQPAPRLTLDGLTAFLQPVSDLSREEIMTYLASARADYFEKKYMDYTYARDLRSVMRGWAEEFHDLLRKTNTSVEGLDVLDVGIGNGLEARELFEGARSVVGVDVSQRMLDAARQRWSTLTTVCAPAEAMSQIPSRSVDLYVSLRTYMSRLFDVRSAVTEAVRVLRPDGFIVLSIANGYVEVGPDGRPYVIRGLKIPGSYRTDPEEPHHVMRRVRRVLWDFGFQDVSYESSVSDVYLWARAPEAARPIRSSVALGERVKARTG